MNELIDLLVKQLGVSSKQAEGGAAVIFKAARDKAGSGEFDRLFGGLPGAKELAARAPESGGLGKLFGGLAGAVGGGNAAILANVVTSFGSLGLTQDHAKQFVPVILGYLRGKLGADKVAAIERALKA
jgi:hypothetical protein